MYVKAFKEFSVISEKEQKRQVELRKKGPRFMASFSQTVKDN